MRLSIIPSMLPLSYSFCYISILDLSLCVCVSLSLLQFLPLLYVLLSLYYSFYLSSLSCLSLLQFLPLLSVSLSVSSMFRSLSLSFKLCRALSFPLSFSVPHLSCSLFPFLSLLYLSVLLCLSFYLYNLNLKRQRRYSQNLLCPGNTN